MHVLKKGVKYMWTPMCQAAFEKLKDASTSLAKFTIWSTYGRFYRGTWSNLLQEGKLVAYESQKLNNTEKIYLVHELELYAIVHALKTWRHYLGERHFFILTNNASLNFFETQPNLFTWQAKWQAFIAQFHYKLKYQKRRDNIVVDALSHRIYLITMSFVTDTFLRDIKDFYPMDPYFGAKHIQLLDSTQSKTSPYTLQEGILFYKDRICVPDHGDF